MGQKEQDGRSEGRVEHGWNCIISFASLRVWSVVWSAGHRQDIYTRVAHINHVIWLNEQTVPAFQLQQNPAPCGPHYFHDTKARLKFTYSRGVPPHTGAERKRRHFTSYNIVKDVLLLTQLLFHMASCLLQRLCVFYIGRKIVLYRY